MTNLRGSVLSLSKIFLVASSPWEDASLAADPLLYSVTKKDGSAVGVTSASAVGPRFSERGVYLHLRNPLSIGDVVFVSVDPSILLQGSVPVSPNPLFLRAEEQRRSISFGGGSFTGEAITPFLGAPAGQVFFSPSLESPVATASTLEVDQVDTCVDLVDAYTFPPFLDPKVFFTYGIGASLDPGILGSSAFTLAGASPFRYNEAVFTLSPTEEDTLGALADGPALGLLVETFDPSQVALLNNSYWTLEGTGTEPQPFFCANTLAPIPPGATTGPFPLLSFSG